MGSCFSGVFDMNFLWIRITRFYQIRGLIASVFLFFSSASIVFVYLGNGWYTHNGQTERWNDHNDRDTHDYYATS